MLLSLRLDLTEPLAFALVQWGVLFFDRDWNHPGGRFYTVRHGYSGRVLAKGLWQCIEQHPSLSSRSGE